MVFKRRKQLSWGRWIVEGVYPRSGWRRAASYVVHRLRRLPDTSHKIARGVGIGIFVSFTPFFGLHFVVAALMSLALRGNVLAALLSTFFGNPLTFPFIAAGSLTLGTWMLGVDPDPALHKSVFRLFAQASGDFWHNFKAIFNANTVDWTHLGEFFRGVFLPYLLGGIGPGILFGLAGYFLSQPVIAAYQKRRKRRLLSRLKERHKSSAKKADEDRGQP
ncbi:MAG: DUF2062 domain-containing protein [Rhodobacteraceae bacterium]|nr:DUF2062 domain-containing protein [Paracoccaceae bacterium]